MSGHSKWHSIKHQKAITDSRRSAAFTKLANIITIAAREGGGGDPDKNFKLRLAIQKAREANMPNDNVERAIKRGTGEDTDAAQIQEIVYEGYGPEGVAFLIETVTDNKNRTSSDIRSMLSKAGGSMGSSNSVAWQFAVKGVARIAHEKMKGIQADELQLKLIDAGAEDVQEEAEGWTVVCAKDSFSSVLDALAKEKIIPDSRELEYVPTNPVQATHVAELQRLVQQLEEHDDVQNVYTNAEGL